MSLDTILIVDDEAFERDALSDFFTSVSDYEVLTASSGDEAVELLKKRKKAGEKTKAVIMDIKMPGKNGLEASLDIKNEVDRNIPVIFNTAFPAEFSESILRDKFLFFAYQTKGDDLDELSAKVERAVKHYNLMNETVESYEDDLKSFTVKDCALLSSKKGSPDVVRELLEKHRGRPYDFLQSIINNVPYTEKVRFIDGTLELPNGLEEGNDANPSKVVCYGSFNKHKAEIFDSLLPGGQAIFVADLPNMSKDDKLAIKMRLNEQGFIIENITETIDKKLVIEARKPIIIEDARAGLILKEAQNDKEMRDYYAITRAYFDMLTREIDMTFDQSSAHFVVYKKDGMVPISTIRVVPKEKIRLPVEFGTLSEGSLYNVKDKSSSEISHTANLTDEKAKEKGIHFRTFGSSLLMVFSAALMYNVLNKIDNLVLTYDKTNTRLQNLYLKLDFKKIGTSVGYPGYPEKYTVMSLNIAESAKNAVKTDNKTQLAILSGVMNDPLNLFIDTHDKMFADVPAYRRMYDEVVAEIEKHDCGLEKKLVVDMPVITGNLSRMLAGRYDITGVELSKSALVLAENKAKEANPNVKYSKIEANVVEGVPIESNSADYVACINLLYALKEPEKALAEIYRILKPGGYAVITNFNENALLPEAEFMKKIEERFSPEESRKVQFWKSSNDLANISSDVVRESYFSQEALCAKIREAGLEVESIRETFLGNSYLAVARKK